MTEGSTSIQPPAGGDDLGPGRVDAPALQGLVFALFIIFGGVTSLNDVLIPKLKERFTISIRSGDAGQSAFFAAYFRVSIPASGLARRLGYMRTASNATKNRRASLT